MRNVKLTAIADQVVVDLGITPEEMNYVHAYAPEKFVTCDDEGNETFKLESGGNSLSQFGANVKIIGNNGNAAITVDYEGIDQEDKTTRFIQNYKKGINRLDAMVTAIKSAKQDIEREVESMKADITVVDAEPEQQ